VHVILVRPDQRVLYICLFVEILFFFDKAGILVTSCVNCFRYNGLLYSFQIFVWSFHLELWLHVLVLLLWMFLWYTLNSFNSCHWNLCLRDDPILQSAYWHLHTFMKVILTQNKENKYVFCNSFSFVTYLF